MKNLNYLNGNRTPQPSGLQLSASTIYCVVLIVKFAVYYVIKKAPILWNKGVRLYVYVPIIRQFNLVSSHVNPVRILT
jgi:hypothetical protein